MSMSQIILAQQSHLPRIHKIIMDAQAFLKRQGIDQWQNGYPDTTLLEKDIQVKQSYLWINADSEILATLVIRMDEEPTYQKIEGKWLTQNPNYGVIHRLAVNTDIRQKGCAQNVIKAAEELCKLHKKISMRIDTHKQNKIMQHILKKGGYTYCGIIYVEDGSPRYAYEKILQ